MTRRNAVFLAVTAFAVSLEVLFAFDGNDATRPWTAYLIRLPWWILAPAAVGLSIWIPVHLFREKHKHR